MKHNMLRTGRLLFSVRGLLCLVVVGVLATGCQNYRRFKKTIKGKKSLVYQINTTGNTEQTGFIYTAYLVKDLGEDAGQNTVIESCNIEALSIEMAPNATNTADAFRILSLAVTNQDITQYELLNLSKLPTTSFPLNKVGAAIINSLLLAEGLDGLNREVSSRLVGRNPGSLSQTVDKAIAIRLRGTNIPANSRVSTQLTINLDITIEYTTCLKVPELLFLDIPECK